MKPLLVILRYDHGNLKPSWDPGAHADIDGDGTLSRWEQEAVQLQGYGDAAWRAIAARGGAPLPAGVDADTIEHLRSLWASSGVAAVRYGRGPVPEDCRRKDGRWLSGYSTSHRVINKWGETWHEATGGHSVVLCLHANAGGPTARHGIIGRDRRSSLAERFAEPFAKALEGLSEVSSVTRTKHFDDRKTSAKPWLYRGMYVLGGAFVGPDTHTALLIEPGFLDSTHHKTLWYEDGHRRLGAALVDGAVTLAQALDRKVT